jgi:hypothetical protein
MPTNLGPNLDTRNLVTSLETFDINQSYFGEPATNSQSGDNSAMTQTGFNNWGCYDTVGYPALPPHVWGAQQSKSLVTVTGPFGKPVNAMLYHNFTGGFHGPTDWGSVPNGSITAGRTYTVQGWVKAADSASIGKTVNAHTYYTHSAGAYSAGTNYTLTDEWQLVSHTHTAQYTANSGGTIYFFTQNSGPVKMFLTMTSIIFDKAHPVQWLLGGTTRTADQSLRNPVDGVYTSLTNMSHLANNKFTFDGTDDQFTVTTPQYTSARNFTFIAWVRSNGVLADGRRGIFTGANHNGGYTSFFGYNGQMALFETRDSLNSDYLGVGTSGFSIYDGTWAIVGFQITDDSLKAFYVKGGSVQINSNLDQRAGDFTFKDFIIGRDSSGFRWNGDIDGIKFFNRVLTSDELTEYYTQNKNRFV